MKQDISKYVGQQIRKYRLANKMTQKELGLKIGVKHNTISSYESGTNEPEQNVLFAIAKALNVSINDLFPPINGFTDSDNNENQVHSPTTHTYPYIPVSISAGLPIDIDTITSDQVETISIPDEVMGKWAGSKDIFIMRLNGDSMNKIMPHNSLIAVKKTELGNLKDGDIVVYSDGASYAVKHFYNDKTNQKLIFRPASTDVSFTDYIVSYENAENVKLHGKVVMYVVEMD